jgi:hypothetical protein
LPPDLIEFQREFAAALDGPAAGAMAVYRNTVLHGAVEALRANYPVVEQVVGQEMFEAIAVDFASECPPRRPVLALYGECFADWTEAQPWVGDLPYLPDVARVERLRVECLMAADAEPLSEVEARHATGRPGSRLALHPAVRFTWLSTPAMSIWLAHQRGFDAEIAPNWKAEGALFARPYPNVIHAPRIGRAAHRLLFGIRLGESLGGAISAAAKLYPQEDCTAVFASLVNLGAFVAPSLERIL